MFKIFLKKELDADPHYTVMNTNPELLKIYFILHVMMLCSILYIYTVLFPVFLLLYWCVLCRSQLSGVGVWCPSPPPSYGLVDTTCFDDLHIFSLYSTARRTEDGGGGCFSFEVE